MGPADLRFRLLVFCISLLIAGSATAFCQQHSELGFLERSSAAGVNEVFPNRPVDPFKEQKPGFIATKKSLDGPIYVVDSTIVWSVVDTTRRTHSYNPSGKVTMRTIQRLSEGAVWENLGRETYSYDERGNLLSENSEEWTGEWVVGASHTYTYDSNDNLLSSVSTFGDPIVGGHRETYTYDARGNMTEEVAEHWNFSRWEYDARNSYTYDGENRQLSSMSEDWRYGGWVQKTLPSMVLWCGGLGERKPRNDDLQ
jgi:uncharacterized protein RhaS with RHS repeats